MKLSCRRDEQATLEATPVYANGPTGLVSLTISHELGDHLTVYVPAAELADLIGRATGQWRCSHSPRCADAACSDNPAVQEWLSR